MHTLAFLVTTFPPEVSGASFFNWERAQWFAQQGYRVVVFAPDAHNGQRSRSEQISETLTVERYPSKPWLPYPLTSVPKLSAARWISDRLYHHQPDLILSTDVDRFFLLGCWQAPGRKYATERQVPYVAEFHTDLYNFSSAYAGWQWLPILVKRFKLAGKIYQPIDVTICPSASAAQTCHEIGIERTELIPFCGIDLAAYGPQWRDRTVLNQWLTPEEKDHKVILFLGRLAFEKRVDLLIDAFAHLKQTHPNYSLILAGDAPSDAMQSLKHRAAKIPHVHFTGFLLGKIKSRLMASCDIFCSPSPYETFGLTLAEAMASGIPVITVNSGAAPENIQHQTTGYLAPPNNVAALADMIQIGLTSNNRHITQNALTVVQKFSLAQGCQRLETIYQKLIRSATPVT
jgi:phosphatidylinositol alpha 1,6-mannosyltransferase